MQSSAMDTRTVPAVQAARWFHALSDETRVELLRLLAPGERCVCDLVDATGAAQSRLSFHLKVLKSEGLVQDRREGRWSYYSIRPEALDRMAGLLRDLRPSEGSAARSACREHTTTAEAT